MDIFRDGIRVCPLGLLCFCLCSCVFCLGFWFAARLRNRPPPSLHPFKLLSNWNRPPTLITIQAKPARLHITNHVFDLMTEELPPFVKNTQLIHFSHVWCGVKSVQGFDRRANTHGQLFWRVRPKKKCFVVEASCSLLGGLLLMLPNRYRNSISVNLGSNWRIWGVWRRSFLRFTTTV
jgi:hypothetical protein